MPSRDQIHDCPYNHGVGCVCNLEQSCYRCGWHPSVEHRRRRILRQLAEIGKLRKKVTRNV